jgi:hypothetical protein
MKIEQRIESIYKNLFQQEVHLLFHREAIAQVDD